MRRLFPLWIFILIFVAAIIYLPGLSKYLKLKGKETKLEQKIEELAKQIKILQEEEYLLKNDLDRLEEVVREELGLVKPGEIVYKVVEEEITEDFEPLQNS